jgi:hypothetical protein
MQFLENIYDNFSLKYFYLVPYIYCGMKIRMLDAMTLTGRRAARLNYILSDSTNQKEE